MKCKCPVCLTADAESYGEGSDRLFGIAKGKFGLCRCGRCGCVFQHPMPEASALAAYYPREYWWAENGQRLTALEKRYREFVTRGHVRFLEKHRGAGSDLLDIGCGNGTFLHLARSRGFAPHGMDVSSRAVEIARTQYGLEARSGAIGADVWGDQRFDFVTMFHVLEHLPDPRAGIRYAAGLLKAGGTLIVQVPNIASMQARLFRSQWYGLDVPRHVINFTPKGLKYLLDELGFEYVLPPRFSLRDNPASIASSLAPSLDPIGRKGRGSGNPAAEIVYFGIFLLAVPFAFIESALGFGGTIWAAARRS